MLIEFIDFIKKKIKKKDAVRLHIWLADQDVVCCIGAGQWSVQHSDANVRHTHCI